MKRFARCALAALALLASGMALAFPSDYDKKVYSVGELAEARAQATRENKLIIVYFGIGKVCPGCRYVEGQLDTRDTRNAFAGKYVFVKGWIGDGEDMKLARQYGIRGAPQFLVLAPTGEGRCLSRGAFNNSDQARLLGNELARVSSWPPWSEPRNGLTIPRCLDVIENQALLQRQASTQ